MRDVKVNKIKLIVAMEANLQTHRRDFEEAMAGFRTAFITKLDDMIGDAKKGRDYQNYVGLTMPQDHSEDYVRVIEMLKMDIEETVILSEREFAQYVQDDWGWKAEFTTTNSFYTKS